MQQGFDYAYDKRLYDRLRDRNAAGVRAHLGAGLEFQNRCARFLENHDEPRAAATFAPDVHRAAAILTFLTPGLRFFHEGQLEGRRVHTSMHLGRRPAELPDPGLQVFYRGLLDCLKHADLRSGKWRLCPCWPAWSGNPTWDRFLAFAWDGERGPRLLVTVNYGPTQGQCYVERPLGESRGQKVVLRDLLSPIGYERDSNELATRGLYLDMPAWGYHVFEVR
jgi:hypothetical protein